jgi:group I intron endonuclease
MKLFPFTYETINSPALKRSGVYTIVQVSSGRAYIGAGRDIRSRIKTHYSSLNLNKHYNRGLQAAWNKAGPGDFLFEITEECPAEKHLDREQFYIKQADSTNPHKGFNLCSKGSGDYQRSDKERLQYAERMRERWEDPANAELFKSGPKARKGIPTGPRDEAFKQKRREAMLGNKINEGRKQTPEEIKYRHELMLGNQHTKGRVMPEHERLARSLANKGIPKSPETRERMRQAALNRSTEHRKNISKALRARREHATQ